MSITVYAQIQNGEEVAVELRDGDYGRYAVLEAGVLWVLIHDRAKALEIASRLEKAVQQWEDEE